MSSQSSLYPSVFVEQTSDNIFPSEEVLIRIPHTILHLIDKQQSLELASGEFTVVRLLQGPTTVAVLARVADQIQWPLAKDEAAVKIDDSHYFFSLRVPNTLDNEPGIDQEPPRIKPESILNYGLTIFPGGECDLGEFDGVLEKYSLFSTGSLLVLGEEVVGKGWPEEERAAAFWTTVAPNVEEYASGVARGIAAGTGQVVRGILWCGDVTVERLNWGNELLSKRIGGDGVSAAEVSPQAMSRMKRVKEVTKMTEKVATGILSGVVKVSGFFTNAIVNSTVGKKFFSMLPGEIVLASLDGFNKICDAVEVAGRNVMSTSSVVTTGLVSQRYGDEAAKVTNEGLDAAGHAIGTAWAVFKIRKALNPKSVIKPTTLAKAAAARANSSDLETKNMKQQ